MKATAIPYQLQFKTPAGTSRGVLYEKKSWFLIVEENGQYGIGECSLIPHLSPDDQPELDKEIERVCRSIQRVGMDQTKVAGEFPALAFALEMACLDLQNPKEQILFDSDFTAGKTAIPINGLIWMGEKDFIQEQIETKIEQGFSCLKLKVGALAFEEELAVLNDLRQRYSSNDLEIRLDANGAFSSDTALEKLSQLSNYNIHSIEQPIKANQWDDMVELIQKSPIPIALDEELIGRKDGEKKQILDMNPHFLILKPSLLGGFSKCLEWIQLAENREIGWWVTSALESNIGLNAIAQWVATLNTTLPQGLGTGALFVNNFSSPLATSGPFLQYHPEQSWQLEPILQYVHSH